MKRNNINILISVSLVAFAVLVRIVYAEKHMYNFAPIVAIGLFSCAIIKDKRLLALLIPLCGQFFADLYFQLFTHTPGFYPGELYNYAGLAGAAALGFMMKQPKFGNALAYVFGASTLFFLVSNFGYFMAGYNGFTFAGLEKTYSDAIPFYRNTFLGDIIGGTVLFGSYFIASGIFSKKLQQAKA